MSNAKDSFEDVDVSKQRDLKHYQDKVESRQSTGSTADDKPASSSTDVRNFIGVAGAGAIGGAIVGGTVLGTPIAGATVGAAAWEYLAGQDDELGNAARASGKAFQSGVERAKQLNEEYRLSDSLRNAANAAVIKAKQLDSEYHIADRLRETTNVGIAKAKQMDEQYQLSPRVQAAAGKILNTAKEYHVVENTKAAASVAFDQVKALNERYGVTAVVGDYLAKGFNSLAGTGTGGAEGARDMSKPASLKSPDAKSGTKLD